jgi:hypothetical protein
MTEHQVTCVQHDIHRNITSIGAGAQRWSTAQAISEIDGKRKRFYTLVNGVRADVQVMQTKEGKKYLRTDPDKTTRNNLDDLPTCSS